MNDRRDDGISGAPSPDTVQASSRGPAGGTGAVVADALAETLKDPAPRPFAGLVVGAFALVILLCASLVLVGGTAVQGMVGRVNAFGGLPEQERPPAMANGSANVLVTVTDVTPGADPGTPAHLAHVVVVHLARDGRVSLVRLPVSSLLTIAEHPDADGQVVAEGAHPLTLAYDQGGPPLLVRAIERATSLRMDGYAQVSLPALAAVAGTGGLPVCLPEPVDDPAARLKLAAGQQDISGRRLTTLLRATDDGTLAQVRRYQIVAGALLHEFFGRLPVPPLGAGSLGAAAHAVEVDDGFDAALARRLALSLRDPYTGTTSLLSVPYEAPKKTADGVVTPWNRQLAGVLFDRIGQDDPVDVRLFTPATVGVQPSSITVRVENGAGEANLAEKVTGQLRGVGIKVTGKPRNAGSRHAATTIYAGPKHLAAAQAVQQAVPGSVIEKVAHQTTDAMLVVAGQNYDGVRQVEYVKGARPGRADAPRPQVDTSGACRG